MTEKQINSICYYCKEPINKNTKVCFHCGCHQNKIIQFVNQYINHLSIIFSICLLIAAFWQLSEARNEHKKAQEALEKAQKAEKRISDASKAIAKVLLAQSTLKGDADSFDVLMFFPKIMQNEAKSLLDTIEVSPEEQQNIYKLSNLLNEWQQTTDSVRKETLKKEIEKLINQ